METIIQKAINSDWECISYTNKKLNIVCKKFINNYLGKRDFYVVKDEKEYAVPEEVFNIIMELMLEVRKVK